MNCWVTVLSFSEKWKLEKVAIGHLLMSAPLFKMETSKVKLNIKTGILQQLILRARFNLILGI